MAIDLPILAWTSVGVLAFIGTVVTTSGSANVGDEALTQKKRKRGPVRPKRIVQMAEAQKLDPGVRTRTPEVVWAAQTSNEETGNVPTGTVGASELESWVSCQGCPRRDASSCYAWTGRIAEAARRSVWGGEKLDKRKYGTLAWAIENGRRNATMVRLGAIGDPAILSVATRDSILGTLRKAKMALVTYTHFWKIPGVAEVWRGYAMASCESSAEVDRAVAEGWRAAVGVPKDFPRQARTPAGHVVIVCPAQIRPGAVTCNTCRLCDASKRGPVIAFRHHGSGATRQHVDPIGFGNPAEGLGGPIVPKA